MLYEVSYPDPILHRLSRLKDEVKAIGMGKEFGRVLSDIQHDLSHRPLETGETMYILHHFQMPVKVLVKAFLTVVFVVHDTEKLVMVTSMKMLGNHPFPSGIEDFLNS